MLVGHATKIHYFNSRERLFREGNQQQFHEISSRHYYDNHRKSFYERYGYFTYQDYRRLHEENK